MARGIYGAAEGDGKAIVRVKRPQSIETDGVPPSPWDSATPMRSAMRSGSVSVSNAPASSSSQKGKFMPFFVLCAKMLERWECLTIIDSAGGLWWCLLATWGLLYSLAISGLTYFSQLKIVANIRHYSLVSYSFQGTLNAGTHHGLGWVADALGRHPLSSGPCQSCADP